MTTPPRTSKFPLRLNQVDGKTAVAEKKAAVKTYAGSSTSAGLLRPQAPLQYAAQAAQAIPRAFVPSGLGLDSVDVRKRMVADLRKLGISNESVLNAFMQVPRHLFVDSALVTQAYADTSLPIGHGQTISKPSVIARMLELLMSGANAKAKGGLGSVLEIGTGCGYQAALLSALARSVMSIERVEALHEKARALLQPVRSNNLRLIYGDGMLGHPPNAPYDSIISAAGGDDVPAAWLDQLNVGGRLIAPVRDASAGLSAARQVLVVIDKTEAGLKRQLCEEVRFVPLKSGVL